MSAETQKIPTTIADQLSGLDERLAGRLDDVVFLANVQRGIARLLTVGNNSEVQVRRILQQQFDAGEMRRETYQLVNSMLDRYVSEQVPTTPTGDVHAAATRRDSIAPVIAVNDDEPLVDTTVLDDSSKPQSQSGIPLQVGSVLRDRFMLQERVAGGSMGVVYKALDRRMAEAGAEDPWVAIKLISPQLADNAQSLRALQQEAAKGRRLTHANIVRFIDLDRDDDQYFIVMEWLEGRTLAEILDSPDAESIDHESALRITRQLGSALDYAHRCGIVHADVKPGNVMMLPDGQVKLFDFGVARVRQKQDEQTREFDPGVLGAITPAYSSMQVLTGEDPAPTDDVFSLACLLYRLIASYRVFGPRNAAEAAEEGMQPQRPQGLGDAEWHVIKKALSYARVTRYQTMREFTAALEDKTPETIALDVQELDLPERPRAAGGFLRFALVAAIVLGLLAVSELKFGWFEPLKAQVRAQYSRLVAASLPSAQPAQDESTPAVIGGDSVAADALNKDNTDLAVDRTLPDAEAVPAPGPPQEVARGGNDVPESAQLVVTPQDEAAAREDTVPLQDFSKLPPPDLEIPINTVGRAAEASLTLREDSKPKSVDLVRSGNLRAPLALQFEEVSYSGNRSPWRSGQLKASDNGAVFFPAGQARARIVFSMASDPVREADQQATLRLRETDNAESEYATLTLVLEDDDQRKFESGLPANTVGFAASQVSVHERDPVVQIDVIRFNPDDTPLVVGYSVKDITAKAGVDYFAPSGHSIAFGPGQRSARLLIPLVQDTVHEPDEAFVVELATDDAATDAGPDVYKRIVVMIRDDDK